MTAALSLPLTSGLGLSASSAAAQQAPSRAAPLVVYFSRTGNTRVVAGQIRRAHGADLFEIEPAAPYPEDYEAVVRQAQAERDTGYRPPLRAMVADIRSYGVVFIGFPIWGMSTPPVIRSFLAGHDLSGKTLIPFVTHGGYGLGDSISVVAAHAPQSRLLEPFTMRADQERETLSQVSRWLGNTPIGR
ncbi:Flavodoxin [Azospirillum oryzae]|uniref:Flavodoxin n=1 Tax=Azospirillum oryzae TaxID=286727 RepID=A0A1X7HPW2_9PROT|nr:flavodoxin [Azospirillum oryzae]SMF90173.1 Flavodoxin [Azospirillum oryzae]